MENKDPLSEYMWHDYESSDSTEGAIKLRNRIKRQEKKIKDLEAQIRILGGINGNLKKEVESLRTAKLRINSIVQERSGELHQLQILGANDTPIGVFVRVK